ncbi:MAG: hypothetical protein IJ429_03395 [Lachnospiraceae bacterium]|nr:hypothetical protein [Lachnospiraceae bacterium]
MKKTKICFYLLFFPYILLLIYGVISAHEGCVVGFFGDQTPIYGVDAFQWILVVGWMVYWYFWALCLIGQIVLLIWEKVKNKGKITVCIVSMIVVYTGCTLAGYGLSFIVGGGQ